MIPSAPGAVFTRPEVVDFMLNLGGYTVDKPLYTYSVLEPSCGEGDFVIPIVKRLMQCYQLQVGVSDHTVNDLQGALRAIELNEASAAHTRSRVVDALNQHGVTQADATRLAGKWVICDDFLLSHIDATFTHVFGNPPYVRHESIRLSMSI